MRTIITLCASALLLCACSIFGLGSGSAKKTLPDGDNSPVAKSGGGEAAPAEGAGTQTPAKPSIDIEKADEPVVAAPPAKAPTQPADAPPPAAPATPVGDTVQPAPIEQPVKATGDTPKAGDPPVADAKPAEPPTLEQVIVSLRERADIERKAEKPEYATRKALLGALIAIGSAATVDEAARLLAELECSEFPDRKWLTVQRGVWELALGNYEDAAARFKEAQRAALKAALFRVEMVYHAFRDSDANGFRKVREKLDQGEKRENAVYSPGEAVVIGLKVRYLNGVYDENARKYQYAAQVQADLHESNKDGTLGERVKEFKPVEKDIGDAVTMPPEELLPVWFELSLPHDIKPNVDYKLKIRLFDRNRPEWKTRFIERTLIVKVRVLG